MAARTLDDYFLQPDDMTQRRYETLRAVFVEGLSLQDAAGRFHVSYGTVRNWASEFRQAFQPGQRPPFSPARRAHRNRNAGSQRTEHRSRRRAGVVVGNRTPTDHAARGRVLVLATVGGNSF